MSATTYPFDVVKTSSALISVARVMLLAASWLVGISGAQAATTAEVVESHPSPDAALGRGESFWVRMAYASDEPVRLWARPFRAGVAVKQAFSNASLDHAGTGEALGWFALNEPGTVDEVRIVAGGGSPYREWELARYPVDLEWTSTPSRAGALPAWVDALRADEESRRQELARQRAAEPVSAGELALFNGFMLLVLALIVAGVVVPLWVVWKWRGGWRLAAAIPLAVMAFVVLRILFDTARDPTSHNLWPFEILMSGAFALGSIGALKLLRRLAGVRA